MSQRAKRPNRSDDGSIPVKRRKRTAAEEEEAASLAAAAAWQPRSNDLKSIYNRTTTEAPAELFRKDLISAMKLPDSEPLASHEYWIIIDQWKQEWERGVQVPVNPDSLPEPSVTVTHCSPIKPQHEFKLPKNKYIRITKDDNFKVDDHALSSAPAQSEAACSYDLDECDTSWLKIFNAERAMAGLGSVYEDQLERVIEQFELSCWDKIQTILRNEEGLGIEYDENVICDVCRSPDSEEGNEMVFCDSCNICVHQACYGITRIPEGQWLCCTCQLSKRPKCVLCPNKGGAMKCTRSGQKWAHVSCALWIPEVSIGCVEKMEPITKISSIPTSRWALICVLCRERVGACIQCSVKTCKTAYHVTCAFKHGLEMRAIIEDENADDGVKLRSYCEKHSKSSKKEKNVGSGSEDDDSKRKKRKDMTSEEKNQARAARLQEIEAEFYKHVSVKDVSIHLDVDNDALHYIYNYWKLKRKAGSNKPLLPPKSEDVDMLSHKREQADQEKMKMFVQLRQDLERVRNLCYMVSRREKLSRSFFRLREQTFHKQAAVLESCALPSVVVQSVIEANHGPSIYDRLYSHADAPDHTADFERILARIAGVKSPTDSGDEKKPELNGLLLLKDLKNNPYKKVYVNGTSKRRSCSLYGSSASSASSSDEKQKDNKENRFHPSSSEEEEKPSVSTTPSSIKKRPPISRKSNNNNNRLADARRRKIISKIGSSSEEDIKKKKDWGLSRSRLVQVERELGYSGSDSDELMPIQGAQKSEAKNISFIYSDSESTDSSMKNDEKSSSSQQNRLRTKAAVKEFCHKPSTSKSPNKSSPDNKKKNKIDGQSKKESPSKKKDYVPSDLIVPQRQAAKKATENLKSTTVNRPVKDQPQAAEEPVKIIEEKQPKLVKSPKKPIKEIAKEPVKKELSKDIFDIEKDIDQEILAYVPQRQAAKKAAEHIKSGLGKPAVQPADQLPPEPEKEKPKKDDMVKSKKDTPRQDVDKVEKTTDSRIKSSSNSSSSSSSSSSSDSSTSSSSDSDDEPPPPTSAAPRSEGLFSAVQNRETATKRTEAKNWPFLDKAVSSSSDSSDSSRSPSPAKAKAPPPKVDRKSPKRKEDDSSLHNRNKAKPVRPKAKLPESSDRVGSADVRTRDLSDSQRSDVERDRASKAKKSDSKEGPKSSKLHSPVRKTDKKVNETSKAEPEITTLEREILERKAGKQGSSKTKSTLDRLFGERDKKSSTKIPNHRNLKPDKLKSTVKENKEPVVEPAKSPVKKAPIKNKIEVEKDVFTEKTLIETNEVEIITKVNTPKPHIEVIEDSPVRLSQDVAVETNNSDLTKDKLCLPDFDQPLNIDVKSGQQDQLRSLFSSSHATDLLDFDNFDDGFCMSKDDELIKAPLSFTIANSALIKEDSKEDSARETLNLVEKLRLELSKKSTNCDVDDGASVASSTKNENDRAEFTEQVVPNSIADVHKNEIKVDEVVAMERVDLRVEIKEPIIKEFEQQSHQDFSRYINCTGDVPLENHKLHIPNQASHNLSNHGIVTQGDERWVPPGEPYANIPPIEPVNYIGDRPPPIYMTHPMHHKVTLSAIPPQIEARLHEAASPAKQPSPALLDRRISQTPLLDPASMDCMPSPSPYADMHPQAKWADSEIMPNRRSSSSSAASSSSSCSRRNDDELRPDVMLVNHPTLETMAYLPPQALGYPPTSLENFPSFGEPTQFVSPVSLFPAPNMNAPLPFSAFPPAFGAPFPTPHSVMPPLPKPVDETFPFSSTCTATFTSSQHNMALTAAMVNMPPALPKKTPEVEVAVSAPPPMVEALPSSIVVNSVIPNAANNVLSSPSPSIKSNHSSGGKKSPSKPTRTSARVTSQLNKSPSKSPAQEITKPSVGSTRGRGESRRNSVKSNATRNNQGQPRGRGRGRGRGRNTHHNDFNSMEAYTIHNKLVGTVYDFDLDDDISSDNMTDLRSMRERRRSIDVHERKSDSVLKESSASPKFSSPTTQVAVHKSKYNTDLRDLRPPTPEEEVGAKSADGAGENAVFPDMVAPVLPGPVDMRTYSTPFDQQTYNEANLLSAFASGTTETQVHDEIDEDFEKELHSALTATKPQEPPMPEVGNIKVSLSDSRNQLKVKIKGPIANYSSTVAPLPPPTVDPIVVTNINSVSNSVISHNSSGMSSGTSNLRPMRKKELLHYWTQDMNQDDSSCAPGFNSMPTMAPVKRTIITIPKAVASMTSIPTKDDYRDYRTGSDDLLESKQYRKETKSRAGALSRELRQLDVSLDEDGLMDRRRSSNANSSLNTSNKRRGRPPRPSQTQASSTPKIKIKISNNSIVDGSSKIDDKKDRIRPPKKRLATMNNKPSVEDLKRESMKFRKLVMADFGEVKEKKKKKDKSEKRKRKKSKQEAQIISNKSPNSTKLIIRIGKKVDEEVDKTKANENCNSAGVQTMGATAAVAEGTDKLEEKATKKAKSDGIKITPIKLKLSRCQEGSGYVMKRCTAPSQQPPGTETGAEAAAQPGQPPPPPQPPPPLTRQKPSPIGLQDGVHGPTPLPLNKDCEVR